MTNLIKEEYQAFPMVNGETLEVSVVKEYVDYDPAYSNNGGDYYQPSFDVRWVKNGKLHELCINDNSCGDFGSEISVEYYKDKKMVAEATYGSRVDTDSSFDYDRDMDALIVAAYCCGYWKIPAHKLCTNDIGDSSDPWFKRAVIRTDIFFKETVCLLDDKKYGEIYDILGSLGNIDGKERLCREHGIVLNEQ